uniref:Uncharacterized protein n=1 Tax=Vitis vinifera TaxID=29760 RepID=A5BG20_VITVI|nr:hypothetical protein VITISV_006634 [Vitis vinifera]
MALCHTCVNMLLIRCTGLLCLTGTVYEEMGFRHSYSENVNPLSPGRQNWNMEFKDATAAAQAAAESAERASMAARAAAELSSRGRVNTQYSTESQKSSAFDSRDEGPGKFAGSKFQGEHLSKVSANNSFHDRNPRSQNVQMDGNQQDNLEGVSERLYRDGNHRKSSQYSSLKSDPSSIDEVNTGQRSDSYSQRSSSAVEATKLEKGNFFEQSDKSEVGFLSEHQGGRLKSVVDQNDLDREPFYVGIQRSDEEKHPQSQRSSRLSFVHEVKDKDLMILPHVPSEHRSVASSTPQHSIASTATQQSTGSSSVKSLASHAVHSQEAYNQEARTKVNKKSTSRSRPTYFDSDTDDSEEELPELPQHSSKKESYNQKAGVKDNTKLSPIGPITYFGMDDDSEEDIPKPTLTSTGRPTSSFSRRTKASSNFETSSYSKSAATYESATASNNSAERKTSSRRSHSTETMPNAWSQTMSSGQQERKLSSQRLHATESAPESQYQTKSPSQQESSEWHRSSEQATHKPMPEPKTSLEKESSKYPAIEQQSNPVPKTVASGGSESSKPSSSSTEPPSRENSIKKASHVHPKLPDYESLAARFQSLRVNRQ